jgi:hypothetical protein
MVVRGSQGRLHRRPKERGTRRMAQGTVKWFNDAKGIPSSGRGRRMSCPLQRHPGTRLQSLAEGDKVEFEVTKG